MHENTTVTLIVTTAIGKMTYSSQKCSPDTGVESLDQTSEKWMEFQMEMSHESSEMSLCRSVHP